MSKFWSKVEIRSIPNLSNSYSIYAIKFAYRDNDADSTSTYNHLGYEFTIHSNPVSSPLSSIKIHVGSIITKQSEENISKIVIFLFNVYI